MKEQKITSIIGHVKGTNFVLYDPGKEDPERSKICILKMYGSTRAADALPDAEMEAYARMGYRACNCSPQTRQFITQLPALSLVIDWIKENVEGVEKVVLWGNSRGCNLNSAYQRIAENGASTFQTSKMFKKIPDMTLTPADGIMHFDANHGYMVNLLASLATDLKDDDSVMARDPDMDPCTAENGMDTDTGSAVYSDEFLSKHFRAQAERYNRLLAKAMERQKATDEGKGMFADDEPFTVVMGFGNVNNYQVYSHDRRFYNTTKKPAKLLHPDGTVTVEVVGSLMKEGLKPVENFEDMSYSYSSTLSEFLYLGMHVDEDGFRYDASELYGVDRDNFSQADGNASFISCPTLCVGRTAGTDFLVAEWIYDASIAEKKDLVFIEGMTHGGGSSDAEKYPNVNELERNYADKWLLENVLKG